jgi:prepilin-type N-terminal cleavage/methylation domain-containing protein
MKIKLGENGFTLFELLITLSILGAITGVMAMTIMIFMKVGPESNDRAIALRQVQNAGYWISRDVLEAGNIIVDEDPGTTEFMTLNIRTSITDNKTVVYDLGDMAGGLKKLMRTDQDTGNQILVAEYLYYDPVGDPDNSTDVSTYVSPSFKIQIAAISGDAMVIREYEATQRVPQG